MKKFEDLGLSKEVISVLEGEGFDTPTEIQEKKIPLALAGRDIVGQSATGSGNTFAFGAPIIENLKPNGKIQSLILTPTRELAEQVSESIRKFSRGKRINVVAIYGGVDIGPQMRRLQDADIVVGTPGRILDHMQRETLNLKHIKYLILDEVDRMFDMGFHIDVEKIIKSCPKERQTMLFSATITPDISHLVDLYTKNAAVISVKSYHDSSKIQQTYYDVDQKDKFSLLIHLLHEEKADLVMVFCSTRRNTDFVAKNLNKFKINAEAIHGGLDQKKRNRILKEFHGKGVGVLVCTDVAARGLDIKSVTHIYNYDLPKTSVDYIHRIGRTARASSDGKVINLLCGRDYENFGNILRDERLEIKNEKLPNFKRIQVSIFQRGSGFGRQRDYHQEKRRVRDNRPAWRGRERSASRLGHARERKQEGREHDVGERSHGRGSFGGHRGGSGRNFSRGSSGGHRGRNRDRGSRGRSYGKGNYSMRRSFGRR